MKKKHYITAIGIFALLSTGTSGCTDNNAPMLPDDTDKVMSFNIIHPKQVSSDTRVTTTAFEEGDQVGLFITRQDAPLEVSGNYVNNAALTFDGNRWNPEKTIYWDGGSYNIYAYYPQIRPIASVDDLHFSVSTNQNTPATAENPGGYEASDFLWASKLNASASSEPVSLQFSHRMSRMLIRLVKSEDYEGELPNDAEVFIHNTIPQATIDLSAGVVTHDSYGTHQSIQAQNLGSHKYAAIIVPQRLDNRQPLVEVIMKGVSYLYESKFVFKPGVQHTVQLIISKNPEQIKIEIGGELEDWEE